MKKFKRAMALLLAGTATIGGYAAYAQGSERTYQISALVGFFPFEKGALLATGSGVVKLNRDGTLSSWAVVVNRTDDVTEILQIFYPDRPEHSDRGCRAVIEGTPHDGASSLVVFPDGTIQGLCRSL